MIPQKCIECGKIKELKEFHKNRSSKNGYLKRCKICQCNYQNEYRQTGKYKINNKQYRKKYNQSEKGKLARRRFCIKYPERRKAQSDVQYAIKIGRLPRLVDLQCHYCSKQAEQYHHPNYAKPLDVIPTCKKCHIKIAV